MSYELFFVYMKIYNSEFIIYNFFQPATPVIYFRRLNATTIAVRFTDVPLPYSLRCIQPVAQSIVN